MKNNLELLSQDYGFHHSLFVLSVIKFVKIPNTKTTNSY